MWVTIWYLNMKYVQVVRRFVATELEPTTRPSMLCGWCRTNTEPIHNIIVKYKNEYYAWLAMDGKDEALNFSLAT